MRGERNPIRDQFLIPRAITSRITREIRALRLRYTSHPGYVRALMRA